MADISRDQVISDMEAAADRMGLDLEDLQEMIGEVLADCTTKSKRIEDAIGAGDIAQIKAVAHDIKGSTANYGLVAASALALDIEKACEDKPTAIAAELTGMLENLATLTLDQS